MANFSDFCVSVDWQEFERATAGDKEAIESLQKKLDRVWIYFHAFPREPGTIDVTIADVISAGIVKAVKLNTQG